AELKVDRVLAGKLDQSRVTLRMFGGPTPDGRSISTSLSVHFAAGRQYLLFLANQSWYYTPLTAEPLRVQSVKGRELLVNRAGFALTGLGPQGMRFNAERLYPGQDPSDTEREQSELRDPRPEAIAGGLDRQDFLRLLSQGIAGDGLSMRGVFNPEP